MKMTKQQLKQEILANCTIPREYIELHINVFDLEERTLNQAIAYHGYDPNTAKFGEMTAYDVNDAMYEDSIWVLKISVLENDDQYVKRVKKEYLESKN